MRTLVVGCGYWGQNYIRELGRRCVFGLDVDPVVCDRVQTWFGVPCGTRLPGSLDFDAVVVCTPPETHYWVAKTFLELDKYVLVEKPMTMSVSEAEELTNYDKCMAGLVYLFHPEVERLRRVFQFRTLVGKPLREREWSHLCSRRTNEGSIRRDVSVLWDLAPHDVSIFNYVVGETPRFVKKIEERDYAILRLVYSTITAVCYVSWCGGPKTRLVELVPISGERVVFDDMQTSLEKSPLARMLEAFMSKDWDRSTVYDGLAVVRALSQAWPKTGALA